MAVHRAEQVLDAVVAKLLAGGIAAEKHRVLSYDPDMELPAVSVRMGPDAPLEAQNIVFIDSQLTVVIDAIVSGDTEADAIAALLALRTASHVALMADQTLGLPFVSDTRYAGATAPIVEADGKRIAARQECSWLTPYRMKIADPSLA